MEFQEGAEALVGVEFFKAWFDAVGHHAPFASRLIRDTGVFLNQLWPR
jgi:hypothetical protein